MNQEWVIRSLEKNKEVFHSLLAGIDIQFQQWRPAADKWNMQEILCHLLDEEIFDFKARVKHTLETPGDPMASINPVGWVLEKNYAGWNYQDTLEKFMQERLQSVAYLQNLKNINGQSVHQHPQLGAMSAENFLFNWLAHDYLHIRQINRYYYLFFKEQSEMDLSYAGNW